MNRSCCILLMYAGMLLPVSALAQAPAFPGAEGYGGVFSGTAPSAGWFSNATVYHVTNLNDDGAGSFRNAFQQNSANKVIVFDVAGTINLTDGKLDIKNLANYYIAGQTAPGPVTIYGDTTQLTHSGGKENRNVVLRYLSFRKGTGDNSDAITFAGSGLGTNLILDHVSASWSEDEILSVANNNTNVTVQYSMINDALVSNHAYGSLIRPRISSEVTFHHNLYANNASRQARFGTYNGETLTADFRNNVIYNYRDRASYTGGSSESDKETTNVNYVGNYIVSGPGTQSNSTLAYHVDKNVDTTVYQSGNYIDPDDAPGGAPADGVLDGTNTGTAMFAVSSSGGDQTLTFAGTPFATPPVATQSAPEAYQQVVNHVGNWWWNRDAIDSRVISNVTDFTGVPIGAAGPIASELSGLLAAPQVNHPAGYDTDNDGMPNDWELAHGLNPNLASDWNLDFDNDGYINLIDFINEKGEFPAPAPIRFNGDSNNRYAQITNWKTDDGGITSGTNWQPSKYDTAIINNGTVEVDSVGQHAGTLSIAPDAGNNATLNITSGWLMANENVELGSSVGTGNLSMAAGSVLVAEQVVVNELGQLSGNGDIIADVINSGDVAPGTSAGTLSVEGNFLQTGDGTLSIEIASTAGFDKLIVDGDLTTGGTLEVTFLNGYSPEPGDSFDILDWTDSKSGEFLQLSLADILFSEAEWDISLLETQGILSVVDSPFLPGDFNNDGFVDGADYTVWLSNLGAADDSSLNGNGDGTSGVDSGDYDLWKSSFVAWGNTTGEAADSTIPEPTSLLLLLISVVSLSWRHRSN